MIIVELANGNRHTYKNKHKYGALPMEDGSLHVFIKETKKPVAFFAKGQWVAAYKSKKSN